MNFKTQTIIRDKEGPSKVNTTSGYLSKKYKMLL